MCIKPATLKGGGFFPCGQCVNCRVNKKRILIARCLLETAVHKSNYFLTLTYGVDHADGPYETFLSRYFLRCFFKRLRNAYPQDRFKYIAVGEYGELKGRAHYHILLWCDSPFYTAADFTRLWGFGSVDVGDVELHSIEYVASYLLSISSVVNDVFSCPDGRSKYPPFRVFSQGIGADAVKSLAVGGVLPAEFRVFGKNWPVGRYLKLKHLGTSSVTDFWKVHGHIPITQRAEVLIEQALHNELRSLPFNSPAYEAARDRIVQYRKEVSETLIKKKQIAHYRSINNSVKGRKNETF